MDDTTPTMRREDPRVTRSKARILAAVLDEVAERGYAAMTIEGIAERAGAGKSTVYRHWDGTASLLIDALGTVRPEVPEIDSGDLRTDLVVIVRALAVALSAERSRYLPVLVEAAERDPELAALTHDWVQARRRPIVRALEAAVARGDLPEDADVGAIADVVGGPLMMRRLVTRQPLTEAFAEAVVDALLPGMGRLRR